MVLNNVYQGLQSFYDVIVLPSPPHKPTWKVIVEKYVQYLKTHLR